MSDAWMNDIQWTAEGLVPVIAQDHESGRVLMFAWMNRESLALTRESGVAVYWSRSRGKLWRKGEESGHLQRVKDIAIDCDGDVLLVQVEQVGGIACHTGRQSCFFRALDGSGWITRDPVLKLPSDIYRK